MSQLNEDAILGKPLLTAHSCRMEFDSPVTSLRGKELTCTGKHRSLMIAKVQAWKSTVIQPGTEVSVVCRISTRNYPPLEMIEGCDHQLPVACS